MIHFLGFNFNLVLIVGMAIFLVIAYFGAPVTDEAPKYIKKMLALSISATLVATAVSYLWLHTVGEVLITYFFFVILPTPIAIFYQKYILKLPVTTSYIRPFSLALTLVCLCLLRLVFPLIFGVIGKFVLKI